MRTAFLTGGTGFVGGHVARALAREGWTVRLLARDPRRVDAGAFAGLPVEVVPGGLENEADLARMIAGAGAIVHVAGLTKARTLEEYRAVNVQGTERLLAAARRAAPEAHFVLVSSQAAAGPAIAGRPVSHGDPARPVSWYGLSKREGEQAVEGAWKGPWTVLRPGVVYGPGDRSLFVYFRMASTGWIPVPAGKTRVHVIGAERAALAVARAAGKRELAGQIRFLSDPEPVAVGDLAAAIAGASGRPGRLIRVPDAVVRLLGGAETLVETLTRRSRPFNADKARELLAGDWLCDAVPVGRELALPAPAAPGGGHRGGLVLVPAGRLAARSARGRDFVKFANIPAPTRQQGRGKP